MPHVYDEDVSFAVQQFVYAAINAERNRIIAAIEEACDTIPVYSSVGAPREAYIALNRVRDAIKLPIVHRPDIREALRSLPKPKKARKKKS